MQNDGLVDPVLSATLAPRPYKTVREHIIGAIRQAILDGSLRQGEKLVERRLASQFGISLSVVREALIELESQGYITKTPNTATIITNFSARSIDEVFTFRRIVEAYAVEKAAELATPEQIAQLRTLYLELHASIHGSGPVLNVQRDLALHEWIWHMCGNKAFEVALQRVLRPFFAFTAVRIAERGSFDLVHNCNLHLAMVNAIAAHDPQQAKESFLTGLGKWKDDAAQDTAHGSHGTLTVF